MSRLLPLLALLTLALPTAAQGTFVSAQSGRWNAPETWTLTAGSDADGLPDADDTVTIGAGHTVDPYGISDGGVGALTVEVGGALSEPAWLNINVRVLGPMVNRGTVNGGMHAFLGGDLTNTGVWAPLTTRLESAGVQTLTFAEGTELASEVFDLNPSSPTNAGSDLTFRKNVYLGGGDLRMGPYRLTLRADYVSGMELNSDAAVDGVVSFSGGRLRMLQDVGGTALRHLRVEGIVTLEGTAYMRESVAFQGEATVAQGATLTGYPGATFTLTVDGDLTNRGSVTGDFIVRITGDITNAGVWDNYRETVLTGPGPQTLTLEGDAVFGHRFIDVDATSPVVAGSDLTFREHLELRGADLQMGRYRLTMYPAVPYGGDLRSDGPGGNHGSIVFTEGGQLAMRQGASFPSLINVRVDGPVALEGEVHIRENVVFGGPTTVSEGAVLRGSPGAGFGLVVEGDLNNEGTITAIEWMRVGGSYRLGPVSALTGVRYPQEVRIGGSLITRGDPSDPTAWPVLQGFSQLTVGGLDVDGLVLDNTWLVSEGGDLRRFDHVLLRNVPNDVTQVLIRHPGLPGGREFTSPGAPARRFPVRNVTFAPLYDYAGGQGSHDRGLYMAADDTDPDDGNELAIAIEESSTGGGVIDWVDRYGSPEANYYGSFLGSHVFWPEVERAALEENMARATFGAPQDPDYLALYNLTVAFPGQVVVEYDDRWKPVVRLCPDGPGQPCVGVEIQDGTYTVRASEGTRMQGNVEIPLKQAPPAGTVPNLFALTPLGTLINWGGTLISAGGLNLIAAGGGNLISAGGLNLIGAGGGNIIGQAGSNLISAGGLNLIGAGGGNLIAAGGGNLISAGGLNLIAAGGGNLIGAGGGNLTAARSARRPLDDDSPLVEADGLLLFVGFVPEVRLNARVLLGGALGDDPAGARPLRTTLRDDGDLPVFQPYLAEAFAETPKALPDTVLASGDFLASQPDLVDWVLVELRDGEGRGFRRAALLRADGQVVDFDSSTVAFRGLSPGDYTVAVYHRTHTTAVSAAPVTFEAGTPGTVDFTAEGTAAAGSQREVAPGVFAQVSGDVDADGTVTAADLAAFAAVHGEAGYSQGDLRLDGGASARDAHDALLPAVAPRPGGAPSPGALDARLVHTADPDAGTATLALELRGSGTLGTSTFRVRYDPAAVRPIDGRALAFVSTDGGSTYAYAPAEALVAPDSAVGRPAGAAALRVTLLDGPGSSLSAEYAEVARVRFETLDPTEDPGFGWDVVEAYDGAGGPDGAFAPGARVVVDGGYAVAEAGPAPSAALALAAPFPNPVRAQAAVPFSLPAAGHARLAVYDVTGREVAALVDGRLGAGPHTATLEAGALAPGVYALRLSVGDAVVVRRVTVVR